MRSHVVALVPNERCNTAAVIKVKHNLVLLRLAGMEEVGKKREGGECGAAHSSGWQSKTR